MAKEFNLSEKRIGVVDQNKIIEYRYPEKDIKEFIKIIEARIYNQLRIHWHQLRNKGPREVADFIENIIDKRAGPKLT